MMKRWGWVLGVLAMTAGSARGEGPGSAAWIDRDAIAYFEVLRPSAVLDGLEDPRSRSAIAAFPPARKALEAPQLKELRQVVNIIAAQLETTPEKGVRDLIDGGIVVAIEGEKGKERLVVIVSPGDKSVMEKAYGKLRDLAVADAASKGKPSPFARSEHRGVSIDSTGPTQATAILDGRLVVTNGVDALKMVVDRVRDGKSGIAADERWAKRRGSVAPEASAFAFARLDRLRALDPAYEKAANPGLAFLFGPWYESLRKAEWASATLAWSDDRLIGEIALPNPPGGRSAAMARYVPPKGSGAPAPLAPPRMIASMGLWRDLSSIWEVRAEIFPPQVLEQLAQLDTFAGQFFGGRDFGTGVLGSIAGDWRLVVARQDDKAMDPVPDVKLPAFALIVNLAPGDEEFATRLMSAFQSFVGVVNLGAAQTKAPPLMLGSENFDGTTISTAKFIAPRPKPGEAREPVDRRFNVSPSAARVGDTFVISSTIGLARDLVTAVKNPGKAGNGTLAMVADGEELARLVDQNRPLLVMQDMLKKGHDKATSESEIGNLAALLRFVHKAALSAVDGDEGVTLRLEVAPNR